MSHPIKNPGSTGPSKPPAGPAIDPRRHFAPRILPWILAAAALGLYLVTMNPWVSLLNMNGLSRVAGWNWEPTLFQPLLFLLTSPLRLFPASVLPLLLNLVSVVSATVVLGLLARSVAILPHDRVEAERAVELSDFKFMTNRTAWIPPLFAVAILAVQSGFWQNATNYTGEMVELALFAFVIWEILEFRLDEQNGRLYWAAFAFGLGVAETWAFVGFFPCFLLALVWSKGIEFFHPLFLVRLAVSFVGGLMLFLLLPLVSLTAHADLHLSFWNYLRPALRLDWLTLKSVSNEAIRYNLGVLSLTSLLPLFLLAIRWPESFGDASPLGRIVSQFSVHLVHLVVFGVCIWVMFDPPFSPHELLQYTPVGIPSPGLSLYFLTALCLGYFSGYLLLVFGEKGNPIGGTQFRRSRRPTTGWKFPFRPVAIALVGAVVLVAVVDLAYKSLPEVRAVNSDVVHRYARAAVRCLPSQGGVILGDSVGGLPWRLYAVQAELTRLGEDKKFIPLDTHAMPWPAYQRYLHQHYPTRWPLLVAPDATNQLNPIGLVGLLRAVAQTNSLYYLNPSFGYYFEAFYLEPHGMVFGLKPRPNSMQLPPPPSAAMLAENNQFWQSAQTNELPAIYAAQNPSLTKIAPLEALLGRMHIKREPNESGQVVGEAFSQALNCWGVQLQRCHQLEAAASCFTNALWLNPDNLAAQINVDFNATLRTGNQPPPDFYRITSDQLGRYRTWAEVMNANGPFDDPNYCLNMADLFVQANLPSQAIGALSRVRELAPNNLTARIWLGRIYVSNHLPDEALDALQDPLKDPSRFGLTDQNTTVCSIIAAAAYMQKTNFTRSVELLNRELNLHPDDADLATVVARSYVIHGLYSNAIVVIDRQLQRTPDDLALIYGRGYALFQQQRYHDAEREFTRVIAVQTNNYEAIFDRALARLYCQDYPNARTDFEAVQHVYTNGYPVAYGLSEVAVNLHDTNEVIRNAEIYLAHAPTNTAEYRKVRDRLKAWRGH